MEEASFLIGSLDSLDQYVPDITFAEIDISVDHPTRLRFAERFGVYIYIYIYCTMIAGGSYVCLFVCRSDPIKEGQTKFAYEHTRLPTNVPLH